MQEEYATSDMGIIASLLSLNVPVLRKDIQDPTRVVFVFDDNGYIATQASSLYSTNQLFVPAQQFRLQLKLLQSELRHGKSRTTVS